MVQLLQEGRNDQRLPLVEGLFATSRATARRSPARSLPQDLSAAELLLTQLQSEGLDVGEQLLSVFSTRAEWECSWVASRKSLRMQWAGAGHGRPAWLNNALVRARLHTLRGRANLRMLRPWRLAADFEKSLKIFTEALSSTGNQELLVSVAEAYTTWL